jgi:hypothetical protein
MISLGSITLSQDLIWLNEFDNPVLAQSTRRVIGGRSFIQGKPIIKGREIILASIMSGNKISGYYTRSQIKEITELARTQTTVVLVYESTVMNVIVKADGIKVRPTLPRPNIEDDDWYSGTITMKEV